jgi:hypothetical protein
MPTTVQRVCDTIPITSETMKAMKVRTYMNKETFTMVTQLFTHFIELHHPFLVLPIESINS